MTRKDPYYTTAGELIEKLSQVPADATVLGIVGGGDDGLVTEGGYPLSVADVGQFLNDAGRVVVHLTLFDYRGAGR